MINLNVNKRFFLKLLVLSFLIGIITTCLHLPNPGLTTHLVETAIHFPFPEKPAEIDPVMVDRLSASTVLLIGETHYVQEHQEFMALLLSRLHTTGFRVFSTESLHAYGWLYNDYIQGRREHLTPRQINLDKVWLDALRRFNANLRAAGREAEQYTFACFDINHNPRAFTESLAGLSQRVAAKTATGKKLDDFSARLAATGQNNSEYQRILEELKQALAEKQFFELATGELEILHSITDIEVGKSRCRN